MTNRKCHACAGSETPYTLRMQVQVQIGSMAAVLDQDDGSQIVHSGMQNLQTTVKLYPETKVVSFSVEGVGVVTPQGTLLETGGSRQSLTGGALCPVVISSAAQQLSSILWKHLLYFDFLLIVSVNLHQIFYHVLSSTPPACQKC